MRKWIDVVTETLGVLHTIDGEQAVGYWYHPKSGKYYTIVWDFHQRADDLFTDHADVVFDHPEWFGLTREYLNDADDGDLARYGAVLQGWVRVGFNPSMGLRMDASSPRDAALTVRWFANHHSEKIKQITIDIVTRETFTSYAIADDDVPEYLATGRLQPAWRAASRPMPEVYINR